MPFYNQPGLIVQDHLGNIYNFMYDNGKISYYAFNKQLGNTHKGVIVEDATMEFDGDINEFGEVNFIYRKRDGSIALSSSYLDFSKSETIIKANEYNIFHVTILLVKKEMHIFYCLSSKENNKVFKIYHHYDKGEGWITNEVDTITAGQVINPIQVLKKDDEIILGYYDLVEGIEQIFINRFNVNQSEWGNKEQLTTSRDSKLYLDLLITEGKNLHVTYSQYTQGNYVVKYERFNLRDMDGQKIEEEISNLANCTYPTLIYYRKKLWIAWSEYNYIASRFTEDMGKTWSDIYLWKESKTQDIIRYRYKINRRDKNQENQLNYSFGRLKDLSFIGFGNRDNTSIIPLKRKGKKRVEDLEESEMKKKVYNAQEEIVVVGKNPIGEDENMENSRVKMDQIQRRIKELTILEKDLMAMEDSMKDLEKRHRELKKEISSWENLEERVTNIENFLIKKTRTFRRDKKF